jgi:ABC-type transporter Mla subunit MlaD
MPFIPLGIAALLAIALFAWWLSRGTDMPTAVQQGAEQATSASRNLMVGQVDVGKDVSAAVGKVTTALQSVTDPATARNAVPQLDEATTQLNRLKDLKAQLPAAGKQGLAEIIAKLQPTLQAAIDKVVAIPGVSEVLKPGLDTLMASVSALRA